MRPSPLTLAQGAATAVVLARLARGRSRREPLKRARLAAAEHDDQRRHPRARRGRPPRRRASTACARTPTSASCSSSTTARPTRPPTSPAPAARASSPAPSSPTAGRARRGRCSRASTPRPATSSSSSTPTRARSPGLVRELAARLDDVDLVTASPRFHCATAGERLLHPSMAATIPYRTGPGDALGWQPKPSRAIANGQCIAMRRETLLAAGGWARVKRQHDRGRRARARAARATA